MFIKIIFFSAEFILVLGDMHFDCGEPFGQVVKVPLWRIAWITSFRKNMAEQVPWTAHNSKVL